MTSSVSSLSSASISSAITREQATLQKPITQLQNQAATDKAEISAFGAISGQISSLSAALANIASVSTSTARNATSTTSTVATAKAAASAETGTYSLTSVKLAKPQEIYSAVKSATAKIGSGSLNFTFTSGKTETVKVGSGSQTLSGIAKAINAAAGGISASVIGTSSGARLVLQSSSAGSANAFSFTGAGGLASLSYSPSASGSFTRPSTGVAANASLSVNGVPITSATNTVSSAVSGLTINLAGSGSTTVKVASSGASLASNLSSVASSLNSAVSTIAKEIKFVPPPASGSASASAAKSGPLLGNVTVSQLSNNLLAGISTAAASGLSANAIGFSVSSTGAVTFSSATFNSAYASNPTGVQALVTKIHDTLSSLTKAAVGTGSASGTSSGSALTVSAGSIAGETKALQNAIKSLTAQETQIAKENSAALNILVKEYTTAESNATNASITQEYLGIFNSTSNSSSSS